MAIPAAIVKAAKVVASMLTSEEGRKQLSKIVAIALSPVIFVIILLCVFLQGGSRHNKDMVYLCFYGGSVPVYTPPEYNAYILDMQASFRLLDTRIAEVNEMAEDSMLDAVRVKAAFFALYFGLEGPSRRDHKLFVECFVEYEERTREVEVPTDPPTDPPTTVTIDETYTVAVPIQSLETCYTNISSLLGISATFEQKTNAAEIYRLITGYGDGQAGYDPSLPFVGIDGFVSPVGPGWRGMVTSEFGWRRDPLTGQQDFHRGLDMQAAEGHPIYSVLDGVVISVGTDPGSSYGYHVTIDHGGGFVTLYAHNSVVLVSPGQQVSAGQQVAKMGATGRVTGVHLHLEISIAGQLVNPRQYMP